MDFNAKKVKNDIIEWIRNWFEINGKDCNAVIGISGGKDSSIVAALCVEALGKDRVIGVTMPNAIQSSSATLAEDARYIDDLVKYLGIKLFNIQIGPAYSQIMVGIQKGVKWEKPLSHQTLVNLPPRIRMTTLYAVSQTYNGRVANTCNLSEDYIGYSTRWGDSAGDFAPLANLTVTEVKAIGYECGLPKHLVDKTPADGLCGKTDEDNIGFSYDVLDKYIRTGICEDEEIKEKIDALHQKNLFKLNPIPSFKME